MATTVKMVRAGDLGLGLKQVGDKVEARTIVSQVFIKGQSYLLDSNGNLLAVEFWGDMSFNLRYSGQMRATAFSDLQWDAGLGRWKLKAGTVMLNVTEVDPVGLGTVISNGPSHPLNISIESDAEQFKLIFGKSPDTYAYIEAGVDFGTNTDPYGYRTGELVPSPYLGGNAGQGVVVGSDIMFELDNTGLTVVYGALPFAITTDAEIELPQSVNNYFADPLAPTQLELDAANAAGAIWGLGSPAPGPGGTTSYVTVQFQRVIPPAPAPAPAPQV